MINERNKPIVQDPETRRHNFDEVSLGFDRQRMIDEANRCLGCKNAACVTGCPVEVNIPLFIAALKNDDPDKALEIINETNSLPAVCGRVCPQEKQCESKCVRGIKGQPVAIGQLERYAGTYGKSTFLVKPDNGKKVCVIGSGPASLTCAAELRKAGCEVIVKEAFHTAGGVLVYGIPEFRLPKEIVGQEIDKLKQAGVEFELNFIAGKTETLSQLREEYDAVFIGTGAGLPMFMNIPGESLKGVYSANEYLTRVNLMKAYKEGADTPVLHGKKVCVIGAGNVACDAARTALRLGAEEVSMLYRRGREEMPARREEIEHAEEEGVKLVFLVNPVRFLGENGAVNGAECIRMELGEPDASGRRRPVPVEGSEFIYPCDEVIVALGTVPGPLLADSCPELRRTKKGTIETDEDLATSIDGVFAGGDAVTGSATVILAMGAGRKAAASILRYLGKAE